MIFIMLHNNVLISAWYLCLSPSGEIKRDFCYFPMRHIHDSLSFNGPK